MQFAGLNAALRNANKHSSPRPRLSTISALRSLEDYFALQTRPPPPFRVSVVRDSVATRAGNRVLSGPLLHATDANPSDGARVRLRNFARAGRHKATRPSADEDRGSRNRRSRRSKTPGGPAREFSRLLGIFIDEDSFAAG